MTEHHRLDNLIWVWSASDEPAAEWYPGDGFVDMTGSDVYLEERLDTDQWVRIYKGLKQLAPSKPVALSENDRIPDPERLQEGIGYSYFLTWHSQWLDANPPEVLKHIYLHPYVITRDQLPEFRRGGNRSQAAGEAGK